MTTPLMASTSRTVALERVDQASDWTEQAVICEQPVALVVNGVSYAVMMATPTDLEDFALGFALSEGLIPRSADCHDLETLAHPQGVEIRLQISARTFDAMQTRRRTMAGRTGCGLCGVDSLATLQASHPGPGSVCSPALPQAAQAIQQALARLPQHQRLHAATGGAHAAAWVDSDGQILAIREDVGRHNALDKLIGHMARHGLLGSEGLVLMSSRASYELVSKCARVQLGTLATISAPTSMAIDLARQTGVQLYGFCRDRRAVNYTPAAMAAAQDPAARTARQA